MTKETVVFLSSPRWGEISVFTYKQTDFFFLNCYILDSIFRFLVLDFSNQMSSLKNMSLVQNIKNRDIRNVNAEIVWNILKLTIVCGYCFSFTIHSFNNDLFWKRKKKKNWMNGIKTKHCPRVQQKKNLLFWGYFFFFIMTTKMLLSENNSFRFLIIKLLPWRNLELYPNEPHLPNNSKRRRILFFCLFFACFFFLSFLNYIIFFIIWFL